MLAKPVIVVLPAFRVELMLAKPVIVVLPAAKVPVKEADTALIVLAYTAQIDVVLPIVKLLDAGTIFTLDCQPEAAAIYTKLAKVLIAIPELLAAVALAVPFAKINILSVVVILIVLLNKVSP